jgi:hypothetical protein
MRTGNRLSKFSKIHNIILINQLGPHGGMVISILQITATCPFIPRIQEYFDRIALIIRHGDRAVIIAKRRGFIINRIVIN